MREHKRYSVIDDDFCAGFNAMMEIHFQEMEAVKQDLKEMVEALENLKECQNRLRNWEYNQLPYVTITHEYHRYVGEATEEALTKYKSKYGGKE